MIWRGQCIKVLKFSFKLTEIYGRSNDASREAPGDVESF